MSGALPNTAFNAVNFRSNQKTLFSETDSGKTFITLITESGTIRYDSQNINKKNNGNLKKILSGLPLNQNKVFQIVKTQQISNREYLVEFESKKNLFEKSNHKIIGESSTPYLLYPDKVINSFVV